MAGVVRRDGPREAATADLEPLDGLDPAALNELANLIEGEWFISLSARYAAAARILRAGWSSERKGAS